MSASCLRAESTRPILLATLVGSAVSVLVSAGALHWLDARSSSVPVPDARAAPEATHSPPVVLPDTLAARSTCESTPSLASLEAPPTSPDGPQAAPLARAKEREFRAAFVELERAQPGALDERAPAVLSGDGPAAQKVALLRALRDTSSSRTGHWLDFTVRAAAEELGPRSGAVQTFALETLAELAVQDATACEALRDLAFDVSHVALEVRCRASAAFATVCSTDRLPELSRRLFREPDEWVVAGALSALESRRSEPEVERVLALHGHRPLESSTHEAEPAN